MSSTHNTIIFLVLLIIGDISCGAVNKNTNDPDAIMFPGQTRLNSRSNFHNHRDERILNTPVTGNHEIPLSLIQELNAIDNMTIFLETYLEGEEKLVEDLGIASRFGSLQRSSAKVAKPAGCQPTLQTVELNVLRSNDPGVLIYPSCTRVNRCGGCCLHSLLSCQPVEKEIINYQVIVTQYMGQKNFNAKQKEIVSVEVHTKCKCDCRIKQEDCNSFQQYNKNECICVCKNLDEKTKCEKYHETKLWDPDVCKCSCRKISDCTTGFYFDQNKCKCLQIPVRRRFAELSTDDNNNKERNFSEQEKYDIDDETPEVAPLDETDD